jgi:hypothetical protein
MRRLIKSEHVLLVILAIVVMAAWLAYRFHVQVEAWWWHVRHGETVTVAGYVVPAPRNWYVMNVGEEDELMIRLDSDDHSQASARDRKPRFRAEISLMVYPAAFTARRLDFWTSFEGSQLKKRGLEPVVRKFSFDGEALSCVGGQRFSEMLKSPKFYESDPNVWTCQSAGRLWLQIMATDADMPQVWDIVSHTHKKPM